MSGSLLPIRFRDGVWAAVVVATVLRLAAPALLAVEHYDEAVYAANLVSLEGEGYQYPNRPLYSPPFWPAVLEWFTIVGRVILGEVPGWWTMLPGIITGIALVPSVAWALRRWFGPQPAICAAWMVALSEFHAFYARSALTDAPLLLAWFWAVVAISIALERHDLRSILLAGGLTALAWWTKYNGWLPLAIGISGGAAAEVLLPKSDRSWWRFARTMGLIVAVAALLWLPVLWDCQSVGGYGVVAANHQGYLEPWSHWGQTLWRQAANLAVYTGLFSSLGLIIGVTSVCVIAGPAAVAAGWRDRRPQVAILAVITLLAAWAMTCTGFALPLLFAGSLAGIGCGLGRYRRGQLTAREIRAACLLSAWFLGMLLATPRYYPYPRLLLPLWLASCLLTSWLVSQLVTVDEISEPDQPARYLWSRIVLASFIMIVLLAVAIVNPRCWEDRTALRRVSREIVAQCVSPLNSSRPPIIYVYNEPALYYHLRDAGYGAVIAGDLAFAARPQTGDVYLATGLFADTDETFQQAWARDGERFEKIQTWPVRPSSLRLLDYFPPSTLFPDAPRSDRTSEWERSITLYRLRSR